MCSSNEKLTKTLKTQLNIIDTYLGLMETKDFDKISVRSLVEKANISRGTFYLYFDDVYDLTNAIEDYLLNNIPFPSRADQQCHKSTPNPPTIKICEASDWERKWFEFYYEHKHIFNPLLGIHGDQGFRVRLKKFLVAAITVQMNKDNMPDDSYRKYFLNIFPDLFILLAQNWTTEKSPTADLEQIISIISTMRIGAIYKQYLDKTGSDSSVEE